MTLQDIALRNHDIRETWSRAFVQKFSVSLLRFWSPLYGFDIIRFDDWLNTPDGVSMQEYLVQKYDQRAADIIAGLIGMPTVEIEASVNPS